MVGEGFIEVAGRRIRASVRGRGRPLLLLNGLGGRMEVLDRLREELDDFETIAFDAPGIGSSSSSSWPLRLASHARLAATLLDRLGYRRVDVFGVSWGGALAQEFTLRHPRRVGRLVLAATSPGPFVVTHPSVALAFLDPRRRTSSEYVQDVSPRLFGGRVRHDPELLRQSGILHHLESKTSKGYWFQLLGALGWTSLPRLWRLRHPTLVLAGDDDPLIPSYNARLLNLCLPQSELAMLEGEGHLFVVTSAAETARRMRSFLLSGAAAG